MLVGKAESEGDLLGGKRGVFEQALGGALLGKKIIFVRRHAVAFLKNARERGKGNVHLLGECRGRKIGMNISIAAAL